jgi:hypothetical protein
MAADHGAASVNYVALTLSAALVSDLPPAAVLRRVSVLCMQMASSGQLSTPTSASD